MGDDNRPINVNQYNSEEGKLIASVKWLITRIYEDHGIPDKLREIFYRDDHGVLDLCPAVAAALTNGSLYSQAASKILRDPGLVNQPHGTILRALSHAVELEVRDSDGSLVTEMGLIADNPIRLSNHLALMDALMTAHMKSIVSIERVVESVNAYTTVEKREEPMDCVDALLFWINKICLLVRDDVERQDLLLKGSGNGEATIPEMEDLYEDLCDGTCITALVSFYRPHEIVVTDICFNDPNSLQDCRYNLGLLKNFCDVCLPWNPFHFEIEDILYLHESLQPNINAFLADLFYFFEPLPEPPSPVQLQSPTQRRFIPINAIPDLRAQNIANRPTHPPKVRNNHLSLHSVDRNRTLSLSSQDSLMTNRSTERPYRPTTLQSGTATTFGALADRLQSPNDASEDRSLDGNRESTSLTAIRLAMHQRRQEYEQKQYLENTASEAERQKAGKDAFFKLMKTSDHQNRSRAQSEMTAQALNPPLANSISSGDTGIPPPTVREELLSAQVQNLQEQIQNLTLMNRSPYGMSHAISQPSIHNEIMYGGQSPMYRPPMNPQHDPHQMYAMPYGYPQQQQAAGIFDGQNYAMPQVPSQNYYPNFRNGTPQHVGMSYSMYEQAHQPSISPGMYGNQTFDDYGQSIPNANTFHLHQANASNSRLDPPLELNRNLTNWGLTYRTQIRTPRKTWAEFKSEHDLRNHSDIIQHENTQVFEPKASPPGDPGLTLSQSFQSTPVRKASEQRDTVTNGEKTPAKGFEIKDVGSASSSVTPEMRAKRDALYANLMKRKEQIADKVEEIEAKNIEKRQQELAKQELAEQRKMEKELRRQRLLDEYKRKKLEKEFPDLATSSPNMSARSNSSLQRGHSQPPYATMTKSVSNMADIQSRSVYRPSRAKSNAGDENSTPRISVPSTAEPTLKLFAKHTPKSNRGLIMNSLQYSIFPGAVSNDQRNKVQEALAQSDSKHFLILFRDQKCQYRGLYTWDGQSDAAHRIHGMGPKVVKEEMMSMMFKYDSGSKHFNKIPSKHLSPTIDGFTIQDQLWQKPKIPHSGAR